MKSNKMFKFALSNLLIEMKRHTLLSLITAGAIGAFTFMPMQAERLVLLHTNDTHSQIDPDDQDGLGGIARRKVLIDSVRNAEKNVLLIDAGDAVQGTLYFNLFGGEVEQKAMNALGYDLRILGNHEFDNGADSLAKVMKLADAELLATNYDMSKSPLGPLFHKYATRKFGSKKVGFIGVNLNPKGMIAEGNYDNVVYKDALEAANAAAWWLKNVDTCDVVVAITHIGYKPSVPPGDSYLARNSRNIDVIIGGHSHDLITPDRKDKPCYVPNLDGKEVLVTQEGKAGKYLGEVDIDLDNLATDYKVHKVDGRLDSRLDSAIAELIAPYRAGVDSLMALPVGRLGRELPRDSQVILNWGSDMVNEIARKMDSSVDFTILNRGGLRRGLPKGTITEGQIKTLMPFNNRIKIIDIKGSELLPAFRQMAKIGGNGVSKGVVVKYEKPENEGEMPEIESVTVDGKWLDPDKTYRVATIDYLAGGGDYMPTLANHTDVATSKKVLYDDVLDYIRSLKNKKMNPTGEDRFIVVED